MEKYKSLLIVTVIGFALLLEDILVLSNCAQNDHDIINGAFLSNFTLKIIQPFGRRMCIKACQKMTECKSVNHWEQTMECQLNRNVTSSINLLTYSDGWTYVHIQKVSIVCVCVCVVILIFYCFSLVEHVTLCI